MPTASAGGSPRGGGRRAGAPFSATLVTALVATLVATVAAAVVGALAVAPPSSADPHGAGSTGRTDLLPPADAPGDRGSWRLHRSPAGTDVVWRSPRPLPVTDARAELRVPTGTGSRPVAVPVPGRAGRTLRTPAVDLAGVDTSVLQVWLGADRLDRAGAVAPALRGGGGGGGVATAHVRKLASDPGSAGPVAVEEPFDYTAERLAWHEFPRPMEVQGHVVLPAGVDDAPLVLFLHGRHQPCYDDGDGDGSYPCGSNDPVPSNLGYTYLQRRLATRGYASVSIAANRVNADDFRSPDGGARARSALVRHHLSLIASWAGDPARPRWFGRVDVGRTVLVGHSRGGEGVARAVIDTPPDAPYAVLGEVLVAPTDFARTSPPFTPTVTLLPYCDGDVIDLQGQAYTDVGRDLGTGDTAFRASVLVRGANHNFFNTEWTPGISQAPSFDDWFDRDHPLCGRQAPTRLTPGQQRTVGTSWVVASVRLFERSDPRMLRALDAAGAVTVPNLPGGAVWTHAVGGDRTLVRPGADGTATGSAVLCRAAARSFTTVLLPDCVHQFLLRGVHWLSAPPGTLPLPREVRVSLARAGGRGGLHLAHRLDLSAPGSSLDLRVAVDPRAGPADVAVRVVDADGTAWTAPQVRLPALGGGLVQTWWAQRVRVGLAGAPAGLDLAAVRRVELVARSASGPAWLLDAAARRRRLVPVPDREVPLVSLAARTVVQEGDRPRTFPVEWTLDAQAPVAGRFSVIRFARGTSVLPVDVPAGATTGVVRVPYPSDLSDDRQRTEVGLLAVPGRNVLPGRVDGVLVVRDDDAGGRATP